MIAELQHKAQDHINRNEWDKAISYLKQAHEIEPDNTHILGPLGFCYSRLRQHNQAIEVYERLCQLEPSVARWPYSLGYQYYDQQQYAQAIDHFDKALEIEPGYIPVLYRKGYALSTMEDKWGQALTSFERCRKAYNRLAEGQAKERARKYYADACYQQGKLFLKVGNERLAEERLLESVEMKSKEADVHYALGKLYLKTGHFDQAITSLKTAQRLSEKPQHYILDHLGRAYAENGQLREAIGTYEQMPHYIRNRAYIMRNMGTIYMRLEDWHKAEQTLSDAVKAEHRNHNGHYSLGLVYKHLEKWPEAAWEFKKAIDLRQKYYNLSFPEAQEALENLLNTHPEASVAPKPKIAKPPDSISGRFVGQVKTYFASKGYGFLECEASDNEIFFHIKEVEGRDSVKLGEHLEYTIGQGKKGPKAINLRVVRSDA